MIRLLYIARYTALAVLLLLLLALAPAMAQNVVYQGQITQLGVNQQPGDTYEWELYRDSTVNFATVPGDCPASDAVFTGVNTGSVVSVEWKEPGIYFFKVTARNASGCTNNLKLGRVKVLPSLPSAVIEVNPDSICDGEWAELTVTFSGKDPWSMKLQTKDLATGTTVIKDYTGINASDNPLKIPVGPKTTTEYAIIEVSNMYGVQKDPSKSVILTVHPLPQKTPIYLKKP